MNTAFGENRQDHMIAVLSAVASRVRHVASDDQGTHVDGLTSFNREPMISGVGLYAASTFAVDALEYPHKKLHHIHGARKLNITHIDRRFHDQVLQYVDKKFLFDGVTFYQKTGEFEETEIGAREFVDVHAFLAVQPDTTVIVPRYVEGREDGQVTIYRVRQFCSHFHVIGCPSNITRLNVGGMMSYAYEGGNDDTLFPLRENVYSTTNHCYIYPKLKSLVLCATAAGTHAVVDCTGDDLGEEDFNVYVCKDDCYLESEESTAAIAVLPTTTGKKNLITPANAELTAAKYGASLEEKTY